MLSLANVLRYAAVPLRAPSAVLIAAFSFLFLLASSGGLLGLPLAFIVLSWFFKYGFVLMDHVTEGMIEPPVLSYEMINPINEPRPLALALIVGAFLAGSSLLIEWIGDSTVSALRVLGVLLLPAVIAVQGVSGSAAQSLDPRAIFGLLVRLRGNYLVILAAVGLLYSTVQVLMRAVRQQDLPYALDIPGLDVLQIALSMYAWLTIFALIGGVLFENRGVLGYEPTHSPERDEVKAQRERIREIDMLVDRIFAEWRGGAHNNAWHTVQAQLRGSSNATEDLRELFARAETWRDPRLANRLAQELLPALLARRRNGEALDVVRTRLAANQTFRPLESSTLIRLVELARDAGDRATARDLLADFERHYPEDPAQRIAARLAQQLQR